MNEPAQNHLTTSQAPARQRRLVRALLLGGAAALVLAGYWLLRPTPTVPPPEVDLTGTEPVIAQAIAKARTAVQKAPRSAAAWGRLGMLLRAHDYAAAANDCFARAEQLDTKDPRWPYLQALTLALTDRDAAIPLLEHASERSPRSTAPRLYLAELLLIQGRLDEADRHFRRVVVKDPGNARAILGLARLAQRQGKLSEALAHLEQVVANPLVCKRALILRAEIRQQRGEKEAARADLNEASRLPDDPPWEDPYVAEVERLRLGVHAQLALASQLLRQGKEKQALDVLEETARQAPENNLVFLTLGKTQLELGHLAAAVQAFERALELAPDAFKAHFQLGNALFLQGKIKLAEQSFRKAIAREPGHALAHYNLGHCRWRQGDRSGAIAAFRDALRYRPAYADAHRNLGDLLTQDGKDAAALGHLEEAVRLAPADTQARQLLAEVRSRLGKKAPQGNRVSQ